jgi:oxalate decarboxylase/phosphoglucose isomerase-like protein (cupin superfamily)
MIYALRSKNRQGNARMTAFASSAQATTLDFQAGDISYVPPSYVRHHHHLTILFSPFFHI